MKTREELIEEARKAKAEGQDDWVIDYLLSGSKTFEDVALRALRDYNPRAWADEWR